MIYRALASAIMGSVLASAKKDVIETAKRQIMTSQLQAARDTMLAHVAQKYSEEVEHNVSQYIQALGEASVEIEFKGKPGEALILRAESAIEELNGYLEAQNPDGAVIQFLKKRYKEEGVRIITGRLYGGHYVNRRGQGVYEVLNKMGYAANVDRRKPWLTGAKTTEGMENMLADAAIEIFNVMFDEVDLSAELATLRVPGEGKKLASEEAGQGFASSQNPTRKKSRRGKAQRR
jgi:hypothetical protein